MDIEQCAVTFASINCNTRPKVFFHHHADDTISMTIDFGLSEVRINTKSEWIDLIGKAIAAELQDVDTLALHPDDCTCGKEDCPNTRYVTEREGA